MPREVREPIQVYLTAEERGYLDRVAAALGVSRSEALRRGIRALAVRPVAGPLRDLAEEGLATPPVFTGTGDPPPSHPVAPLRELLRELEEDRTER